MKKSAAKSKPRKGKIDDASDFFRSHASRPVRAERENARYGMKLVLADS